MKYCLALLLASLLLAQDVTQKTEHSSSLRAMVETEIAFARTAAEKTTQEAFLAFIANDGILFRPTAVNGKRWMLANPVPKTTKRPLLSWLPSFADISQAGDMGYTTGPWEFRSDSKDEKPVAFGNFVTVWRKQADGSWKFAIDLGISNPPRALQQVDHATIWQARAKKADGGKLSEAEVNAMRVALTKRDWQFAADAESKGFLSTFMLYSAEDARLLRNGKFPYVGRKAIKDAFEKNEDVWSSQPDFSDVSSSGDLGYTYGTYEVKRNNGSQTSTEKGNYMRIWKQQNSQWKIVLEVANPLPPEEKKS
jgi:ketosteroid isomerase-like protein